MQMLHQLIAKHQIDGIALDRHVDPIRQPELEIRRRGARTGVQGRDINAIDFLD